ncbi:hypothetical protein X798_04356 [Onchocerca flexuosa]|uniref:Uncharacterized protein n=1 Tax=Onchocerca flexuosa TaxID=387005 RepID=A0A238BVE4_9BILA|nr:hypothetical protein X798_04356 [Onchocerca flexuosa]
MLIYKQKKTTGTLAELEAIIIERPLVDIEGIGVVLKLGDFLHLGSARRKQLIKENEWSRDNATATLKICKKKN